MSVYGFSEAIGKGNSVRSINISGRQVNSRIAMIRIGGEVANVIVLLVSSSIYIKVGDGPGLSRLRMPAVN